MLEERDGIYVQLFMYNTPAVYSYVGGTECVE